MGLSGCAVIFRQNAGHFGQGGALSFILRDKIYIRCWRPEQLLSMKCRKWPDFLAPEMHTPFVIFFSPALGPTSGLLDMRSNFSITELHSQPERSLSRKEYEVAVLWANYHFSDEEEETHGATCDIVWGLNPLQVQCPDLASRWLFFPH